MDFMGWVHRRTTRAASHDAREIAELAERVTRLNPRLRFVSHYQRQLQPALEHALDYVRELVRCLPAPHQATAHTWGSDSCIHAFFGTPRDVAPTLSRSPELREFFDQSPQTQMAYAVLGMAMTRRTTLGVALEGEVMRSDVPQTNICFSDHKVRIISDSDAALRAEIVRRIFDQLALEGLARFTAGKSRRDVLDREQTLLVARLRLLERQGMGMRSVVGGDGETSPAEAARLHEQIASNEHELSQLAVGTGVLERQLACLSETLMDAHTSFFLDHANLRLSATNVLLAPDNPAPACDMELLTAHVPGDPPLVRTFSLVTIARGDMLSTLALLDEAERLL